MSVPAPAARWTPNLALSGVAFTALMVAGAAAFPMPPGGDVSPASRPVWLAAHTSAVIAQSYVRALAAVAFLALVVAVATACRRAMGAGSSSPLPGLALAGGISCAVLLLLSQAVGLAAALSVRAGGTRATTSALGALQNGFLDLSSLPAVLLFVATGAVALRTGMLPRWLAWVSLAGAPIAILDAASYDGGPLEAVGFAGLVYFLAWSLLVAVALCRVSPGTAVPAGAQPLPVDQ